MRVINVAVTQGSRKDRQAERFRELQEACTFLGLELIQTTPGGLEHINLETRRTHRDHWSECVSVIGDILQRNCPAVIFLPHRDDWNKTHIGTHRLVMDALATTPGEFGCLVIETEYWQPMPDPNFMVECDPERLSILVNGLTFHKGEVARNPYHLDLPAWMQDNVRRGSELIGGQGGSACDIRFCTLYRVSRWQNGTLLRQDPAQAVLPADAWPCAALGTVSKKGG